MKIRLYADNKGNKQTFLSILHGQNSVAHLAGKSYTEVIRDDKTGVILNLKAIDAGTVVEVYDSHGILIHYELTSNTSDNKKVILQPYQVFVLVNK